MTTDLESLKRDAGRWRAFIGCARIKLFGHAGFDPTNDRGEGNYRHFGGDFWTKHAAVANPDPADDAESVRIITEFADAAVALASHATQPNASPAEAGDGEVLERGYFHRSTDPNDPANFDWYDSKDPHCSKCIAAMIVTAAPPREASPVGRDQEKPAPLTEEEYIQYVSTDQMPARFQRLGWNVWFKAFIAARKEFESMSLPAPTPDAAPSVSKRSVQDFDLLPVYVRRIAAFMVEGKFGELAPDWLKCFDDLVEYHQPLAASPAVPSTQTEGAVAWRIRSSEWDEGDWRLIVKSYTAAAHEQLVAKGWAVQPLYTHPATNERSTAICAASDEARATAIAEVMEIVRSIKRTAYEGPESDRQFNDGVIYACDRMKQRLSAIAKDQT